MRHNQLTLPNVELVTWLFRMSSIWVPRNLFWKPEPIHLVLFQREYVSLSLCVCAFIYVGPTHLILLLGTGCNYSHYIILAVGLTHVPWHSQKLDDTSFELRLNDDYQSNLDESYFSDLPNRNRVKFLLILFTAIHRGHPFDLIPIDSKRTNSAQCVKLIICQKRQSSHYIYKAISKQNTHRKKN